MHSTLLPDSSPFADHAHTRTTQAERDPTVAFAHSIAVADDGIRRSQWETGLFSCFTHLVPNCLMTTCCPCFSIAQISARIGEMPYASALKVCSIAILAQWTTLGLISYFMYQDGTLIYLVPSLIDDSSFDDHSGLHLYRSILFGASYLMFLAVWILRQKTRVRFQLPGNSCADACITFFCACCSIAQMATHVKSYTPGSCSFGPPDTLPEYPQDDDDVEGPKVD
jgi:Cys-rich protein (TIGR01571 family)